MMELSNHFFENSGIFKDESQSKKFLDSIF